MDLRHLRARRFAEIDGEVGAGDVARFLTLQVAQHLRNPGDEVLIYRVGRRNLDMDVANFSRLGKRMVRCGQDIANTTFLTQRASGR